VPLRLLPVLLTVLLATYGCSVLPEDSNLSGKPEVVTSLYPLEFIATEVVGDHAEVSNLAVPGAEPHDLALQPSQVATLGKATTVFYASGFQPEVDKAISNQKPKYAVDAMDLISESPSTEHDPHFWLDPVLMKDVVTGFAKEMQEADPKNAEAYQTNADALNEQLTQLDSEYRTGLANCQLDSIVVSHDAFSYLGARYGLTIESIAGLSPDAEPSPKRLHELSELIEAQGITTIFYEPIEGRASAETLASETGAKLAVLDPLEALPAGASVNYLDVMRSNLQELRKANQCQ
jgi:zinc transport system substrate-binding protein